MQTVDMANTNEFKLERLYAESQERNKKWDAYEEAKKPVLDRFVREKRFPFAKRSEKVRTMTARNGTVFDVYPDLYSFYANTTKDCNDECINVWAPYSNDDRTTKRFTFGQMEGARKVLKRALEPEFNDYKKSGYKPKFIKGWIFTRCFSFLSSLQDELSGLAQEHRQFFEQMAQTVEEEVVEEQVEELVTEVPKIAKVSVVDGEVWIETTTNQVIVERPEDITTDFVVASEPPVDYEAQLAEVVEDWPDRYYRRFQRWYERRIQKFNWRNLKFDEAFLEYPEDCLHHMRNWQHGLKKALLKDKLIEKTRLKVREMMQEQADTGANTNDLEASANVTETANITIVDERPIDTATLHTSGETFSRDQHADIAESDWSLGKILTREYPIKSFEWKVSDKTSVKLVEEGLPKMITDDEDCLITRQLTFFSFLRSGIKVRVQLNGTKFHCGRLIVYFKPLTWEDDTEENFYALTCYPHVFIDASVSNSAELEIPFTHLLTYFSQEAGTLFNDSINSLGSLNIRPYNPLQAAERSSQSLFGQVFVSLLAPTVHLPTHKINKFSYGNGYMQGLEGVLKRGAGELVNMGLGVADKFTGGLVTGAGDAICNLLGIRDKPLDPVGANPILNRTVAPLAHGAGLDRSTRLALSPISQTNTDPSITGALDSDFNILTLCKMPSLLAQPEWNVTAKPGDKLFDMLVTPVYMSRDQYSSDSNGRFSNYSPTILAYGARGCCLWRGTTILKLQIVATQFHSGRLAVVHDPHGTGKFNITDFSKNKSHNVVIVDIQEKQEIEIELPYFSVKPWLRCDRFRSDVNLVDGGGVENASYLDCDSAGVVRIYVLNSLVRPDNVTDKVQINVMYYAGDNFELSVVNPVAPLSVRKGPTGTQYPNFPRYSWSVKGESEWCDYYNEIMTWYNAGMRLNQLGQLELKDTWYNARPKINNPDTICFFYAGQKIKFYMETATGACKKFVEDLPNYPTVNKNNANGCDGISDVVDRIDSTTQSNKKEIANLEVLAQNTYANSITLLQDTHQIKDEIHELKPGPMEEQGLETYTTTRENEGAGVSTTSANIQKSVAPNTISENAMNLQTLLRRFYPLYVSGELTANVGFTIITIPVSPSFVPNDQATEVVSGINRRFEIHNLAWYTRLFTYNRGSLRYKFIVNVDDADMYVWHNPVDVKDFKVTSGFDHDHVVEQMNFASDIAVSRVQQGVEVEVPYYSTFNQLLHSHVSTRPDLRAQNGTLYLAVRNTAKNFNVSVFISTGDDFNMNVLRAPPVLHEPHMYPNIDGDASNAIIYPEFQRSLGHNSSNTQIPGTFASNRYAGGYFRWTDLPSAPEKKDFKSTKLVKENQQMIEQMFKSMTGLADFEEKYEQDVKPAVVEAHQFIKEGRLLVRELTETTLPQVLGHARLFHRDVIDTHETIKEFIPKVNECMEHINAFLITSNNTAQSIGNCANLMGEASSYIAWMIKTIYISSIWLNTIALFQKFTWTNLINIICMLCGLFRQEAAQIVQWLLKNATGIYEDYRSKATNGSMQEQAFEEFLTEHTEGMTLALAGIATVLYCALFGELPSWKYIKNAVKNTIEKKGQEQGLGEFLKSIHFANLGCKAVKNSFEFFREWIEKLINWYIGNDNREVLLERQFAEKADQIEAWMREVEELEDEDLYQLALSDINLHNRFFRLVDRGSEFNRWLLREGVSKNVSSIIRDVNKRLHDMIKRIKKISPGHGFRYAPFVVMLDGPSGVAKSNMMHKFTDMVKRVLDIPHYNSVCTVPKTKEFLDGYEGQAIVEWDDVLQCPKQDEMVAEFINWRSNADCIINKAHLEEKGAHFTSKAIIMSTNSGDININTIRDMAAFRNRINLKFNCYLAPGFTAESLKTLPRDPNFGFVRMDAWKPSDDGSKYVRYREGLTLAEALDMAETHLTAWDIKQNDLVNEYMDSHGSLRIPHGVQIVMEEQAIRARYSKDLTEEEQIDAELFILEFEDEDESVKAKFLAQYNSLKEWSKNKCSQWWDLIKRKFTLCKNKFFQTIKDFYNKYPTFVKAMGLISVFSMAGFVSKTIYDMFKTNVDPEAEEAYNNEVKAPTKLIRAEGGKRKKEEAYSTEVKQPTKLVKAEFYNSEVKASPRLVRAEGVEEGTADPEALNVARNKIHPVLSILGWESEESVTRLQGIAIGGKVILCPHHFFRKAKAGEFFFFMRGSHKIKVEFVPERMFRIKDKDAVLYYMGPQFDSRKNIVDCFIKEADLSKLGKHVPIILAGVNMRGGETEKSGLAVGNTHMTYQGSDEGAPTYFQDGWRYDLDTAQGECGSILIACSKALPPPARIVGMHTAGYAHQRGGFSILLTQEMIQVTLAALVAKFGQQVYGAGLPIEVSQEQAVFEKKVRIIPEGAFSIYGVMDDKFCPAQPEKTSFRPTPFQGELYPVVKKPAMLKPTKDISPLRKALKKYGKLTSPFPAKLIKIVRADILNELMKIKSDMPYEPTDLETAVFGVPGIDYCTKINMKSSPGWPYQCMQRGSLGKMQIFDVNNRKILDEEFLKRFNYREEQAKLGNRVPSIWRDCLKDELRPNEKVDIGKTRLFTIAPVDYTVLVRKYFFAFEQAFYKGHSKFFSAVGINPESYEWTIAYNRLKEVGFKCVAGDFGTYDGTLMADLMAECGEIIDDWYKLNGETDPFASIVRRVLIDEMIHTYQLVQNCVYKTHQGNPSGNPLTVIINTIVNAFYMRLAWLILALRHCPALATMEAFHKHVRDESYGDDNRYTISDIAIIFFNQLTITEVLAEHGIEYTDEAKGTATEPYRHLHDTSFLKRKYRFDDEVGKEIVLPVMDVDTITSLTNWYRYTEDSMDEQIRANQKAALEFAFFHGREFYDDFNEKFTNKLREHFIEPISMTYDECLTRFECMAHGDGTGRYPNFCDLGF